MPSVVSSTDIANVVAIGAVVTVGVGGIIKLTITNRLDRMQRSINRHLHQEISGEAYIPLSNGVED
jgi:hypothetical protein